ncbi:hypothetical protein HMPREF1987_00497, partial [Peptostreptococcaceae bacterium oral taxon 113 str. W5053]
MSEFDFSTRFFCSDKKTSSSLSLFFGYLFCFDLISEIEFSSE